MKISKQQLIEMKACKTDLKRFIEQTDNTDEPVEVLSLIGGKNTTADLLWLADKTLPKEKIVRFACDVALINIEKIKPYTNKYDLIVNFLMNPARATYARAAYAAAAAAARAYDDAIATYAYAADAAIATYARARAARARAARAADAAIATYAYADIALTALAAAHATFAGATQEQIDTLLVKMFEE
tara:strand:+ start:403 stop:963 length:561 start_codon:yes stop_codon:yes gene_type:complete